MNIKKILISGYIFFLITSCGDGGKGSGSSATPAAQPSVILDRSKDIKGLDADKSGLRDDIEALIKLIGTVEQEAYLKHVSLAYSDSILKVETPEDAKINFELTEQAISCLALKSLDFQDQSRMLLAATMNTETRFFAYAKYRKLLATANIDEISSAVCNK